MPTFETIVAAKWEVVAVAKPGEKSHFMQFYDDLDDQADKNKVLALLAGVSEHGPAAFNEKSEPLRDGIFEFRPTSQLRILWFYDGSVRGRIVLTHAVRKKKDKIDPQEIRRAQELRAQYSTPEKKGK